MGTAVSAYISLLTISKKSGDEAFLKSATNEQAEWKVRLKQWLATLPKQEDEPSIYETYDRS